MIVIAFLSVMLILYCTEIAMFRCNVRSGISEAYKNICKIKMLFSCIFRSIAFYIRW